MGLMTKLTDTILLDNGFEINSKKSEMLTQISKFKYYERYPDEKCKYKIDVAFGVSNFIGRDWYVHVDNEDYETIGTISIDTIEQFNTFMTLLGSNFKLFLNN